MEADSRQGVDAPDFQFNRGDEHDYDKLFKQVYKPLCFFAYKFLLDQDKAEDIVQDCLLRFWQRKEHFESFVKIQSFLYVSVRNSCYDELEHQKVKAKHQDYIRGAELWTDQTILDTIMQAEVLRNVLDEVESLPDKCRQVIKMTFVDGKTPKEISDKLGVTVSTVTNQKLRGLSILRKRLSSMDMAILLIMFYQV